MQHKPTIFVSSTCYDLNQIRKDIKLFLEDQLGFDSKLSEYDFPIDPSLGTVENCLQVVKDYADIFVLIVGGRYGQLTDNGKSVTNLEYNCARAKGIPIYAFVTTSIMNMLPIWRDNPSANYSSVVDNTKLFEFVETLRKTDNLWINNFNNAQEIINTLRIQLSYLFSDCLNLRKQIKSENYSRELLSLKGEALKIVLEKPIAWEYRLFGQVLKDGLQECSNLKRDIKYNIYLEANTEFTEPTDIISWFLSRTKEISPVSEILSTLLNVAIQDAVGLPGVPGNADDIVYVGNRIIEIYVKVIKWTLEFKSVSVPMEWKELIMSASAISETLINDLEEYIDFYNHGLSEGLQRLASGESGITLNLEFKLHEADLTEFNRKIEKIKQHYNL